MPKKTADIALGKRKKARPGSYKEHEEYKKRTRPVTIADMVPVKGPIMEAGVGGARKAAVKMARKLMQKMKGSKKTSQSAADKATERLSKTEVPPSKLTPAELREAKTRFMNQRSEQLRPDSFVKFKERGGKSEVVSYSVPRGPSAGRTGIKYSDLGRMSQDQLRKRLDEAINWSKKNNKSLNTDKDIAAQFKTLTGQSIKDFKSGKFDMNKRVVDSKGSIPVTGDKAKDGLYETINLLYGVM